jgi:DNA-binding CsgD family transcriptional regulator
MLTVVARGRIAAARRRLAEIRATRPVDEQVIILLGQAGAEAALWDSKPAEAAQRIDEALEGLKAVAQHAPHQIGAIMLTALGVAAHADLAASGVSSVADAAKAAEALVAIADETAELGVPRAGSLGPEGKAWLTRGRAELARITGPDPETWSAVLEQFGYEGAGGQEGYRQAYARLRRAEALLAGGAAHGLVADDLRVALATADRLGALPLVGAVRAMAERAGVRLDSAAPRPSATDPLTPRERSVLALVAGGRTNRQVGTELFISEKTVSVHLSRVMAKLGAGSRTEAVSIAYAKGLLGPADQELAPVDP